MVIVKSWSLLTLGVCFCSWYSLGAESHFLNEWVAEMEGGLNQAQKIAERHGFRVVRAVPNFDDYYILRHVSVPHRSKQHARHHTRQLTDNTRVKWVDQQRTKQRSKRGVSHHRAADGLCGLNDPYFHYQWYMSCPVFEDRHFHGRQEVTTMKIEDAWQRGYSGKNIVVCVVDDGLEHSHPDIKNNYDPEASYDIIDNDLDPTPRYDGTGWNAHGTRCAGVVAMQANNGVCGAGVAFNSRIGGVRLLDGAVTDLTESVSLSHNYRHIHIYSVSWGPTDNGKLLDGPGYLATNAIHTGIRKGRGGKGVIYVWAAGDGGRGDNCNCDGYASSIYTISVNSATSTGKAPPYNEPCPSTLTTTYSAGRVTPGVVSTDINGTCTRDHSGTSASAPLAAGIIALALEANGNLTWRDMQHLVVVTSDLGPLRQSGGWMRNGAGLCVHQLFGFGMMDARQMVQQAEHWPNVPPQHVCTVQPDSTAPLPQELSSGGEVKVTFTTDGCRGQDNEVKVLEYVQFRVTVTYSRRGALNATAVSPSGTETAMLTPRPRDLSSKGFDHWPLNSAHTWGENPAGVWVFRIRDDGSFGGSNKGRVESVEMVLYGTQTPPSYPSPLSCSLQG